MIGKTNITVNSGGGDADLTAMIDGSLTSITNGASYIRSSAFYNYQGLTTASFPNCTNIGVAAFSRCSSLTTISFPNCTNIETNAFASCLSLTEASFPSCTNISSGAFLSCASLSTAIFPLCTFVGHMAFAYCKRLKTVSFPLLETISGGLVFGQSSNPGYSLIEMSLPACTLISGNHIWARNAFFRKLYLLGSSVAALDGYGQFDSTPISGYSGYSGPYGSIFVRASLLTAWKTATNWAIYSERFVGLTDAEIEALDNQ